MIGKGEDAEAVVSAYITEIAPEPLVKALRVLARCDYPVPDRPTLENQIADAENMGAFALAYLQASDFPLVGIRNAFDKLSARLGNVVSDQPPIDEEGGEYSGDRESLWPSDFDPYAHFGPCGAEAREEYARAMESGATKYQALIRGHFAGERCMQRWIRRVREWFRSPFRVGPVPPRFP